jgi:hypothetical protein
LLIVPALFFIHRRNGEAAERSFESILSTTAAQG